jgi:hypothetical protein
MHRSDISWLLVAGSLLQSYGNRWPTFALTGLVMHGFISVTFPN